MANNVSEDLTLHPVLNSHLSNRLLAHISAYDERDENNNGKWDSGRFLDRRFPEKVYHHEPLLDVRANWELQEQFSVE